MGNPDCVSCIDAGECASGPDPVWYQGQCICFDDPNGLGCQIGVCCGAGAHWDTTTCDCVAN